MRKTSTSRSLLARIDAFTDAVAALARDGKNQGMPLGDAVAIIPAFPEDWPRVRTEMQGHAELGIPSVAVMFDRAADTVLPFCLAVQAKINGAMLGYPDCAFWMGEDDDTVLIVPVKCPPAAGHFAMAGGCLAYRQGWPVADLTEGLERATRRLTALAWPHQRRRQPQHSQPQRRAAA